MFLMVAVQKELFSKIPIWYVIDLNTSACSRIGIYFVNMICYKIIDIFSSAVYQSIKWVQNKFRYFNDPHNSYALVV